MTIDIVIVPVHVVKIKFKFLVRTANSQFTSLGVVQAAGLKTQCSSIRNFIVWLRNEFYRYHYFIHSTVHCSINHLTVCAWFLLFAVAVAAWMVKSYFDKTIRIESRNYGTYYSAAASLSVLPLIYHCSLPTQRQNDKIGTWKEVSELMKADRKSLISWQLNISKINQ